VKSSRPNDQVLTTLEDRMTRRLADSVESLGEIIQEYARKQQALDMRVKDLEKRPKSVPRTIIKKDPKPLKQSKFIKTGGSKKTLTNRDTSQSQSAQILRNSFEVKLSQ
jgi:hypothetical protein